MMVPKLYQSCEIVGKKQTAKTAQTAKTSQTQRRKNQHSKIKSKSTPYENHKHVLPYLQCVHYISL
jgi:hypothetical protein